MRKAIIAAIVASALFAVGAFAANFTVNAEDVASGSDAVTECADAVDVDFDTVFDEESDWDVGSAVVTFYDEADTESGYATTDDCDGFGVTLVVELDDGEVNGFVSGEALVSDSSESVTLDDTVKAGQIIRASVLVDGQELIVGTPGNGDDDLGLPGT